MRVESIIAAVEAIKTGMLFEAIPTNIETATAPNIINGALNDNL